MAKRVRASRSAHRPGGQGPSRAKKTADDTSPVSDEAPEATASDEVVGDVAFEEVGVDEAAVAALAAATAPAPPAEPKSTKRSRRRDRRRPKQRTDDLVSRAAAENVWVREDLRRIGIVSVVLLVGLAVCWVIFGLLDVLSLY